MFNALFCKLNGFRDKKRRRIAQNFDTIVMYSFNHSCLSNTCKAYRNLLLSEIKGIFPLFEFVDLPIYTCRNIID